MLRVVFWALVGSVVLAPLPFGSIFPWSYTLLAIVVAVLVLVWSVAMLFNGHEPPVTIGMLWLPALLFGAVILWLVVQAAPWSPAAWHNPVWADTARALGRPVQGYISVDPFATHTSIMRLLTYAGIFWLALQFGRTSQRAKQVFYTLAVAGLIYAAYGLAVQFSGAKTILWFPKDRYQDAVTSTFRYKNAYATYAGMGLLCLLTLLARALRREEDFDAMGPRERLRTVLTMVFSNLWHLVLGLILIATALLLSDSRGGVIASLFGLLTFMTALRFTPGRELPYRRTFVAALIAAGIGFFYMSGGTVLDRLTTLSTQDLRIDIYRTTEKAIGHRPLLGWGLGSFEGVFAKFQPTRFNSRTVRAHNEYLDNALGMGIPAATALIGALAGLSLLCARGVRRRRRNNHYPAAGLSVLTLAAAHAAVDFTFQVPAVTATLMLMLGVCCAQSWSSRDRHVALARAKD